MTVWSIWCCCCANVLGDTEDPLEAVEMLKALDELGGYDVVCFVYPPTGAATVALWPPVP